MTGLVNILKRRKTLLSMITVLLIMQTVSSVADAQELPPRPIVVTVNMAQSLSFGAFSITGTGGSVIIYSDGSRSSTGDIVLLSLGYSFSTAMFDIEANPGTIISILSGPGTEAVLSGDSGGTMTMQVGESSPASPFVISVAPPATTQVLVGGTLTVGDPITNPPGNYSGTFDVIFVQE